MRDLNNSKNYTNFKQMNMSKYNRYLAVMVAVFSALLLAPSSLYAQGKIRAKHVILIGIDGWASKGLEQADMPTVKNMMQNGSYTLLKRSVLPSASAINWASIFMGVGTESHGYTTWGSKTPEIPSSVVNNHGIFPTIFSILKEQRPETKSAVITDWSGIKYVIDSLAVDDVMWYEGAGYGKKNGKKYGEPDDYSRIAENYIRQNKPTFFFIYFGGLDETGHKKGWYQPAYYKFEKTLDSCISNIVQATKDAGIFDDTVFVLTSDHGGSSKGGHGGKTLEEMLSPFIVNGKGIRNNFEITDAMMQYDVAATVAYLLGVEPPQAWVGRPMMQIFAEVE